ncbi:MAG: AMP-binding protein, partial [Flavobacteriales bacterium]
MITMNVFDVISDRNVGRSASIAVRSGAEVITYGALLAQAGELARTLQQSGLKPGMGLGIVDRNSPEFVIAMLAGLKCGAVVMPIASNLTQPEQHEATEEAQLHAVLREDAHGPIRIGDRSYSLDLIQRERSSVAVH